MAARFVPFKIRIRNSEAQRLRLGHGDVDEFLAQRVIGEALDLPGHGLRRMGRIRVRRAEHHQRGRPPAVERVLHHALLRLRALHHLHQDLVTLALMEAFFLADAHHGAAVRPVGTALQRDLVHDRRPVHQPADGADIRPGSAWDS